MQFEILIVITFGLFLTILTGAASAQCDNNEYEYFCSETNECQSKSRTCNGKCPTGKRYCPRYLVIS